MIALLADLGSTFTKVTLVSLERAEILGAAQAPTTAETGIGIGLRQSIDGAAQHAGCSTDEIALRLACSSAAGGLGMVAVGLMPQLTVEAARRAALNAGAKLVGVFSHLLTEGDTEGIRTLRPDIILLTGGTDGGNERAIFHNALALAQDGPKCPVVVAGNRVVADKVARVLRDEGLEVWKTENVMPEINRLNIEPAQEAIRDVFLRRIVQAKGLSQVQSEFGGRVVPTPNAVLSAVRLLAEGTTGDRGWGDLLVVDVGGATTDVHSAGTGRPNDLGVMQKGLEEPYAKRTVEGDLGIRFNAPHIRDLVGAPRLCDAMGGKPSSMDRMIDRLHHDVARVPEDAQEADLDAALARAATEIAVGRHVGTLDVLYTPTGAVSVQRGKDLTAVGHIIGTGGVFVHSKHARRILEGALYDPQEPQLLRPRQARILLDSRYVIAAMGLLASVEPAIALRILKRHLVSI